MRSAVFLVQLLSIDSRRLSFRVIPVSFCWTTLCAVAYGTGRPEPKCSLERYYPLLSLVHVERIPETSLGYFSHQGHSS